MKTANKNDSGDADHHSDNCREVIGFPSEW
jgi:hypothetical protein